MSFSSQYGKLYIFLDSSMKSASLVPTLHGRALEFADGTVTRNIAEDRGYEIRKDLLER